MCVNQHNLHGFLAFFLHAVSRFPEISRTFFGFSMSDIPVSTMSMENTSPARFMRENKQIKP